MSILVFGNPDSNLDNRVFEIIKKFPKINFQIINPNDDLPVRQAGLPSNIYDLVILDTVATLKKVTIFTEKDLDKFILSPRSTAHDYDLGFQLRYLKKLGKLKKITIIGVPQNGPINYSSLQSIFKKFVAQDMQGS